MRLAAYVNGTSFMRRCSKSHEPLLQVSLVDEASFVDR